MYHGVNSYIFTREIQWCTIYGLTRMKNTINNVINKYNKWDLRRNTFYFNCYSIWNFKWNTWLKLKIKCSSWLDVILFYHFFFFSCIIRDNVMSHWLGLTSFFVINKIHRIPPKLKKKMIQRPLVLRSSNIFLHFKNNEFATNLFLLTYYNYIIV